MPNIVQPSGPEDSPIIVLGPYPHSEDDWFRKPYAGAHGNLLFGNILGSAGLTRESCRTLFTYWKQPTGNDLSRVADADAYHRLVWDEIKKHPRSLILCVGDEPFELITGISKGSNAWRGSILRSEDLPEFAPIHQHDVVYNVVMPLLDPEAIMRKFSLKALSLSDAMKIKRLCTDPTLCDISRTTHHAANTPFDSLLEKTRELIHAKDVAFDIETYAGTITCLGLSAHESEAVVIPLTNEYPWPDTAVLVEAAKEVLEGPARKIGQNLDYDVQYLWRCLGIGVANVWMDTMVAHSCVHPELPHDLGTLTSLYTLHPYYKDMRKETSAATYDATAWRYNGLDACITFDVAQKLDRELRETHVKVFDEISMPAQCTLIRMEHAGIRIDEFLRTSRHADLDSTIAHITADQLLLGVNPNSPKQIKEKLQALLPPSLQPTKTDVHALKSLRRRIATSKRHAPVRALIDHILEARKQRKIVSTYLKAKLSPDRRMRTSYRTSATETGRISSSSDVFNTGMNLQNVPKSQRDWFIPDEGMVFWECDASQIEARITAYVSQDADFIQGFIDGRDFHAENAVSLFGCTMENVREQVPDSHMTWRDAGKRITHSVNYGVGPLKIVEMVQEAVPLLLFTKSDAVQFLRRFEIRRPGVVKWWRRVEDDLRRSRIVYTPFGRRRVFLGQWGDSLLREAIAYVPQSMAADHINRSLVSIEKRLEKEVPRAQLLVQVHDAVGGQCFPEDLERVREIVQEEMEKPLPLEWKGQPLVVPSEFAYGKNWMEAH